MPNSIDTTIDQWFLLVKTKTFMHKDSGDGWYYDTDDSSASSASEEDEEAHERRMMYQACGESSDRHRWKHSKCTESIDEAVKNVKHIGEATQNIRCILENSSWLHSSMMRSMTEDRHEGDGRSVDGQQDTPLVYFLRCIGSVFVYCRKWAYTYGLINSYDTTEAAELTTEATVAFRVLYDECVMLQKTVIDYILSEDFGRDIVTKSKSPSAVLDVIEQFRTILEYIEDFDLHVSAGLWKCCVKICSDHATLLQESDGKLIGLIMKRLFDRLSKIDFSDEINAERNMKTAIFYSMILLRLSQLFQKALSVDLFQDYATLFITFKKALMPEEHPHDRTLLAVLLKMLPVVYARGASFSPCYSNDLELYLELSINILTLLTNATDREIVRVYAKQAFMIQELANILHNIALRNEQNGTDHYRAVVVRLCALIVSIAQRYPDLLQTIDEALGRCSNDYFGSLLCYDVWQLRSAFMTPEQRMHIMLMAWTSCSTMSVFGYRTAIVFKRALLCSFYDTLPIEFQREFVTEISKLVSDCESEYLFDDDFISNIDMSLEQLHLWSVLRTTRIADPQTRSELEQRITRAHVKADAHYDNPAALGGQDVDYYYILDSVRHASYGIHNEQTATLIAIVCKNLHPELPVIFAAELDYVLNMVSHLSDALILCTLETLGAHFAKRTRESNVDQHPDDLIRLLTIDLLCRLSGNKSFVAGDKCVNIIANIFSQLLQDADVIVQTNCLRRFVEIGTDIQCRQIILDIFKHCERSKVNVGRVLRKQQLPEWDIMPGVQLESVKFEHICKGRFKNLNKKKILNTFRTANRCMFEIERLRQYDLLVSEKRGWLHKLNKKFEKTIAKEKKAK